MKLGSQGYMSSITPVGTQEPTIMVVEAPDSNEDINVENGIAEFLHGNNYVEEQSWDDDDIIEEIETFDE